MDQLILNALTHGADSGLAILAAGALIGALLYREDLVGGKRHRRDLAEKDTVIAEWKGIATKNTETALSQAGQIQSLAETVATLTRVVQSKA